MRRGAWYSPSIAIVCIMPDLGDLGDLGRIWANGIRPYRDQTEPRFFQKTGFLYPQLFAI